MAAPVESTPKDSWDEQRCKQALAHLEELQNQLDELRLLIPSIVQVITTAHENPSQLSKAVKQASHGSTKQLEKFQASWQAKETREIFKRASESQKKNSDLTASEQVQKWGWVDLVAEEKKLAEHSVSEEITMKEVDDDDQGITDANIGQIVDYYKKSHPYFSVQPDMQNESLTIQFRNIFGTVLKFVVTWNKTPDGKYTFNAECPGNENFNRLATKCLASRPKGNNFQYLLDMIASYTDAQVTPCAICGKLLDKTPVTPAARRSRLVGKPGGGQEVVWDAIHEGCLPPKGG